MQSSLKMNGFFAILITLFIAGVLGDHKRVEVKRGEKVVLVENESGLENLSRVALYKAKDCNKLQREIFMIFNYCSPKEEESGCRPTNMSSSTFLFENGTNSVSLTPLLHASDGCYVVSYIFSNSTEEKVLIVVNGQLPRSVNPYPPSQENPEANSTKGTETPGTDDPSGITWDIWVGSAVGLIAVCIVVGIIAGWCHKKKKNHDCKKDLKNIKAGEQTPGDSFEMDSIPCSEDEDNHSLNEVLLSDDASVGQENGRPGQHVQNNICSEDDDDDDDDDNNNTNNYRDSNFWSNDEDGNDDEIKSNNTNYYVNNNNNDGVANGGDDDDVDDDDGIASGYDSTND